MDEQEEIQQNNMISNLPLLFANGYPTSLDKISESQLEKFIPFMVQCSLGHINLQGQVNCSEPEWWPEDVPFSIPFNKPKKFNGNWIEKLKEVVIICYQFHKSVFLLRFCNDLSSYEQASLRFINNYNSTTSLFDRRSNKLLVTFRNENMSYDQPQRFRKSLFQKKFKHSLHGSDVLWQMVEAAPFDIYLCDNCDAELYSKEAILVHEKTCSEDDDVILCDIPELCDNQLPEKNNLKNNEQCIGFLLNLNLHYKKCEAKCNNSRAYDNGFNTKFSLLGVSMQNENKFMIGKKKRISGRNRAIHSVLRYPTIPLSSPAGQLLLKLRKTFVSPEYLIERLDRVERFCHTPLVSQLASRSKFFEKRLSIVAPYCTFKKPQEYSSHLYVFPRRQFSQKKKKQNILLINSTLLRRCRPISVKLKKICDMNNKYNTSSSNNLNIKLTRDDSRSSNWKISSSPSTEIIVDTIDLCTSDEEDNHMSYCASDFSYVANNSVSPNIKTSDVNSLSKNTLTKKVLEPKIEQQINYPKESVILFNSLNSSYDHDNTKPSSTYSNTPFIHVPSRISVDLIKQFRPSVYILSNYPSPLTAIVSSKSIISNNGERNEKNNKLKTVIKSLNETSVNWVNSENSVNALLGHKEVRNKKKEFITSISLSEKVEKSRRTLPLIIHQNNVVSIDLTS